MFESASAALRFGASVALGVPFRRRSLDRLLDAMRAAHAEFGPPTDRNELFDGPALDETARRAVQGRRLRKQAMRAATTRYYADVFAGSGIDPATLNCDSLDTVPVTPKHALRADPDAFVRAGARPAHLCTTTGTTAHPTAMWFSDDEVYLFNALSALGAFQNGDVRADDQMLIAVSARNGLGVMALTAAATAVGATVHLGGVRDPRHTLAALTRHRRIADHRSRISVMSAAPSYLGLLVEHARQDGYRPADFGLERVFVGGEVLSDGLRERTRQAFGQVEVIDKYAMTELMPFGGTRCTAGHLHYEPTVCLIEVLDLHNGLAVPPGGVGTLVGTPLPPFRDVSPLLRYDTEDVVRTIDGPLTCELNRMPAIADVLGRRRLSVEHDAGHTFPAQVVRALEGVEGVPLPARYGMRRADGGVAVEVAVRTVGPAVRAEIGDALTGHGVPVSDLRLVDDPALLSDPAPLRCDLRETDMRPTAGDLVVAGEGRS